MKYERVSGSTRRRDAGGILNLAMDAHAEQLAKYLAGVEGGEEVLAARARELDPERYPEQDPYRAKDLPRGTRAALVIRYGSRPLDASFWELPMPEDPEASVRRAVEEDRR